MNTQPLYRLPVSPLASKPVVLPPAPASPMQSLSKAAGWSTPMSGGWWGAPAVTKPAPFKNPYLGMLTGQPAAAPAPALAAGGFGSYGNDQIFMPNGSTSGPVYPVAPPNPFAPMGTAPMAPAPTGVSPMAPAPVGAVKPPMPGAPATLRPMPPVQTVQQKLPKMGAFWDSPRR